MSQDAGMATAQVAAPTKLPAELELVKPLGFRTGPSLTATPVLANLNYLQPPTRVTVVAVQGTFGAAGTFCQVEYRGKGVQARYKLGVPMYAIQDALATSEGSFDAFLSAMNEMRTDAD